MSGRRSSELKIGLGCDCPKAARKKRPERGEGSADGELSFKGTFGVVNFF